MVARSETEAEDRTIPGKKKRKSDVTASSAVEGEEQDTQLFVPVRAEEAKKSRARCVPPMLYRSKVLLSPAFGRLRSAVDGCGSTSASETAGASPNPKSKQTRPKKKRKRCVISCWVLY
jgi:hypothetical protein